MASDFKRPDEWDDEDRMHFLMSPFPPNSRPSPSDAKVTFWRDLIRSSSRDLSRWTFTRRELIHRLSWKRLESKCLPVVIDTLERSGELRRLSGYRIEGIGWMEWGLKILSSPVIWAWHKYMTSSVESSDEVVYVLASVVKELCENILSVHHRNVLHVTTDCIMSHYDFEQLLQKVASPANKRSLLALELQLLEEQRVTKGASEETDEVVVKFAASRNDKAPPVTDMDTGILSILKTITDIRNKLNRKTEDIQSLRKKSIECKRKCKNNEAISYFKKMKTIQRATSNLEQQLNNLTCILDEIQSAETNVKVLKAYEVGVAALRQIRESDGVTVERTEEVMDDMQELLEEGEKVRDIMSTGQFDLLEIDEAELLKELEVLDADERMKSLGPHHLDDQPLEREKAAESKEVNKKKKIDKSNYVKFKPMLLS